MSQNNIGTTSIHGKAEGRVFLMLQHIIYLEDFAVCGPWSILWWQSRLSCWVGLEQKTTKPTMPRMALPSGFFWLCKPPILIKDGHIGIQCSGRTAKSTIWHNSGIRCRPLSLVCLEVPAVPTHGRKLVLGLTQGVIPHSTAIATLLCGI